MTRLMPLLRPSIALLQLCVAAEALRPTRRTWLAGAAFAPLAADAAPATTKVGRGMRAVGTPNKELDLDAALGISWGGASRCDAADPSCVTDGGTGEFATAQPVPQPAGRIGGVATLRISIAGNDEGLLRIGLYSETPVASETFALLAQGAYKDTTESTPASLDGTTWRVEKPFVCMSQSASSQELAYRRRTGSRKTPADFLANTPQKIKPEAPPSVLPAGALSVSKNGPGPDLDFALSFAPSDGKGRYAVGSLLDDASMKLLARLGSLPVVSSRAALGGKAGQPLVKVVVVDASFDNT